MDTCNIKRVTRLDLLLKAFRNIHFDIVNIISPIFVVVTSTNTIAVGVFVCVHVCVIMAKYGPENTCCSRNHHRCV